jgi:hypothetical protein
MKRMSVEKLQDKYAYAPRAMRADRAAAYLGMGNETGLCQWQPH